MNRMLLEGAIENHFEICRIGARHYIGKVALAEIALTGVTVVIAHPGCADFTAGNKGKPRVIVLKFFHLASRKAGRSSGRPSASEQSIRRFA